ncbi:MAG TPA: glutamyl-tRNA reductase [Blastococcus sp.]|jgi:glutamyl-tRNA reductase|nr:glutamyl-tRNA reductase [Blastococcus sp.]
MTIVNIGLSHRIASVEVLEKVAVPAAMLGDVLAQLYAFPAIDEVAVLSTCNRVEVYAVTRGSVESVTRAVVVALAQRGGLPAGDISAIAGVRIDAAAVEHVFAVTCGLDSMAIGEDQIIAQVRAAARAAAEARTSGPVLTGLLDAALRVSKRARTRTRISTAGISLVRAGLDLADAQLGGLGTCRAVVLGTGSTGRLAIRLLGEAGVQRLSVAGRSTARAADVARASHCAALRPVDVATTLADSDLLVTATGSLDPVLRAEQVREAREGSSDRPLLVLDLGMPPDVEPAVGRLAGVTLVDLDAIGRYLAGRGVPTDVPEVRAIVTAETRSYLDRQRQTAAAPFIGAMHAQVRELAETELRRLHGRLPQLTEQERAETAATVYRILRAFLHRPAVRARELSAEQDGAVYLDALRELFDPTARTSVVSSEASPAVSRRGPTGPTAGPQRSQGTGAGIERPATAARASRVRDAALSDRPRQG